MLTGSSEAVERRHDDDVDLARLDGRHEPVERRAAVFRARDAAVDVFLGLPAAGGDIVAKVPELRLAGLVKGAHASVDSHPFRRRDG